MSFDDKRPGGRLSMTNSDPDSAQPGDEYEEHGHTLSALQGRGLRRELSTITAVWTGSMAKTRWTREVSHPDPPHQ